MSSGFFFYSLTYFLLSTCIVYPPTEFISAGLTINDLFAELLGSESEVFIQYHIRRSILTLLVHSLLPSGYALGLILTGNIDAAKSPWWLYLGSFACLGPLFVVYKIAQWSSANWSTHPIAQGLAVYCNNNTTWKAVASDINIEFRRIDKIAINTNSITKVVVTDNWIIKVTPYTLYFGHQSDTALVVNRSDTHALSPTTRGEVQYVNIQVTPTRPGARPFNIRLNALDFRDMQVKVTRPITVLENVVFHQTLLERFVDTFKEQIGHNPIYETDQELDQCVGCMQATSNVKLNKLCSQDDQTPNACVSCFCRPMWCVECMAKWFASRQNDAAPETWLSSKCTCPVCRAKFCLLDVSYVRRTGS